MVVCCIHINPYLTTIIPLSLNRIGCNFKRNSNNEQESFWLISSLSSDEANILMERKRKLDDELQGKLSTELSEMIKKSNAYVKEMQKSNSHYWEHSNKNWIRWKRISDQETS
jgi:hypothetical protein